MKPLRQNRWSEMENEIFHSSVSIKILLIALIAIYDRLPILLNTEI
jgi:hypothetical protein